MSIADARYEPSELEGLMSQALACSEERVQKLRKALMEIAISCDNKLNLSAEEIIGEIAERAAEALEI